MAEEKKLTTAEILALARKQKSSEASASDSAPEPEASHDAPASSAETAAPAKPAAAPKSTADILAAARAQGSSAAKSGESGGAAPKKPASAPKSTADILAAARASGGSAKAGATKEAKPAAKPASKKAPAVASDRPALHEMVAAVKEAKSTGSPVQPKLPPGKPAVSKPKLPKKQERVSRRSFWGIVAGVTAFSVAWATFSSTMVLWILGMARFMMPNMVLELPSQFKVGPKSDFPPGTVSEKFKASRGIWIVNTDQYDGREMIYALISVCTHLGCTPNWLEGEQKFKCPCHGSGFYITGINFEGPAPRPLERAGIIEAPDGLLEVDKSLKFQEELGQWADPKSFELA